MFIDPDVLATIAQQLATVEATESVRILYAVESGSRAWGFPSADSDYDVRFLYVRTPEWYLSIDVNHRRDVIERPLTDLVDLAGWDLPKALRLFAKSNPPLAEWLDSPIVYIDRDGLAERLRGLLPAFYSPIAAMHHYLHMARGNIREYFKGETVKTKKYFYVLRPLLASRWIEQGRGAVPMLFERLLETVPEWPAMCDAVRQLIARKRAGEELDGEPRIAVLHDFIDAELPRLEGLAGTLPAGRGEMEMLNRLFRDMLGCDSVPARSLS